LFIKRFESTGDAADYPDGGCNAESYCNDQFFELETLGPLTELSPGGTVIHEEIWELYLNLEQDFLPESLRRRLQGF
jgi:hypothetical protein